MSYYINLLIYSVIVIAVINTFMTSIDRLIFSNYWGAKVVLKYSMFLILFFLKMKNE